MKTFNEHIKDTLQYYGDEPDDIVWDRLRHNLQANRKKKRRIVFFVVLAILGISNTIVLFSFQNGYTIQAVNANAQGEVKILYKTNSNPQKVKVTSPKITSRHKETIKNHILIVKRKNSHISRIWDHETIQNKIQETNQLVPATFESLFTESEVSISQLPFEELVFSGNFETLSLLNTQLPMKKALLPSRYFVKLMVLPTLNNNFLNGKPAIAIAGNDNETYTNGINLGIQLGKHINRKVDLSTGLSFAYYTQPVTHTWTNQTIFNDSILVRSRKNREVYYYHFIDTAYKKSSQSFTNQFTLIQLPVNIQFNKPITLCTSIYASAGINLTYILKASVNTSYSEDKGMQIEKTPHQQSFRRLGATGEIGFGMLLRLNNFYEVSGGLHSTLSTNYFINGKSKHYPNITGLQMAIRRNF